MQPIIIPTNTRYGFLTVLEPVKDRSKSGKLQFACRCDCGTELVVLSENLRRGNSKSCGCKKRDMIREYNLKHGQACIGQVTPEHHAFVQAKQRCTNPRHVSYQYYGGRGIEFRFQSFEEFFDDVGPRPTPQHSLDRIDTNGHYEPGNVRWATAKEQAQNRRPRST